MDISRTTLRSASGRHAGLGKDSLNHQKQPGGNSEDCKFAHECSLMGESDRRKRLQSPARAEECQARETIL
jgi:hypothetical protein